MMMMMIACYFVDLVIDDYADFVVEFDGYVVVVIVVVAVVVVVRNSY